MSTDDRGLSRDRLIPPHSYDDVSEVSIELEQLQPVERRGDVARDRTTHPVHESSNVNSISDGAMTEEATVEPRDRISQLKWLWFARSKPLADFDQFDLISRGPWGSILLITHLRSRHLAACDALITVFALAIDPFTQQLIHPVLCHRTALGSVARLPRAHNFTGFGYLALGLQLSSLFDNQNITLVYGIELSAHSYGPIWIKALYRNATANVSTVEAYVGQLAKSMTAHVRTNPKRDQALGYVYGSATKEETCIKVRWAWVSFLAGLVILTFVFLSLTIWRTRKQRHDHSASERGAWKSSSLAVLFARLDGKSQHDYAMVNTKTEMMEAAKDVNVSVMLREDGWKLRATQED
ncbi:hypothetical protein CC86DRAFT_401656 [Ophiobolus disseminans]|uniref:Uncharacterized protein n=1 Tax=Ophiobolus disseminans TaxID=1469910 RepID=A0A6A7ACW8_9PLEO|nr:hypothetical protein CC86DRAFT_401656 [Ophiobolus disseminans]